MEKITLKNIEKLVNHWGKNFNFHLVKIIEYKGSRSKVEISNFKHTKVINFSTLQRGGNPFSKRIVDEKTIKEDLLKWGKNKYTFISVVNPGEGKILVEVKDWHSNNKAKVLYNTLQYGHSPFTFRKLNHDIIKSDLLKWGKNKYHFVNLVGHKDRAVLVKIRKWDSNEWVIRKYNSLQQGQNPFLKQKITKELIKKDILRLGKNKYTFIRFKIYNKSRSKVEIKDWNSNKKTTIFYKSLLKGRNPFGYKKLTLKVVKKDLLKWGKSKYHFIQIAGYDNNYSLLVKIRKWNSNEWVIRKYNSLKQGQNPFNTELNRVELTKIQPMYQKLLKKMRISFKTEFNLGSKRIDFVFFHPKRKKWYGLEVKQSGKWLSEKGQISKYKQLASLKQYSLAGVILSDPDGTHKSKGSISISSLKEFILS